MMKDKSLDMFLIVLFGLGGIAILALAWLQPMYLPEKLLTIAIGSIGLFWVIFRVLSRRSLGKNNTTAMVVRIGSEEER